MESKKVRNIKVISQSGRNYKPTKTCVVRAISKEVFAKAGLISCLDYYNERHACVLWAAFIFLWKIARKSDILSQVKELCKMVESMI